MIKWLINLYSEFKFNDGFKSKFIIILFRLSSLRYSNIFLKVILIPIHFFYYLIVEIFMGVEIKARTKIGWGLIIYHPISIVINPDAILGNNCILRHCITIGNKYDRLTKIATSSPVIGDNVEFGANSTIIGPISIGDNSKIGANVFIDFNIPDESIVVPVRSSILKRKVE